MRQPHWLPSFELCHWLVVFCCAAVIPGQRVNAQSWFDTLPAADQASIIWKADHETGDLRDWTDAGFQHPGGGIFNTGGAEAEAVADQQQAHSGQWSARATIRGALRGEQGNRAVRLMRWTERAWDAGGKLLPGEAYYSAWYFIPKLYNPNKYAAWQPNQGDWWNVFQFKSTDKDGRGQPMWVVNLLLQDETQRPLLSLFSSYHEPTSHQQMQPISVPIGKWLHLEAFYRCATEPTGRITLWQDGRQILDITNAVTSLGGTDGRSLAPVWGVGSYTDHIEALGESPGTATIYIDDAAISTRRLSASLDGRSGTPVK